MLQKQGGGECRGECDIDTSFKRKKSYLHNVLAELPKNNV